MGSCAHLFEFPRMTKIEIPVANAQNPFSQITSFPAKDVDHVHINIYKLALTIHL